MNDLSNLRVAVLATDGFEEVELTKPVQALRDAGAQVHVISPKSGKIQGFNHDEKGDTVDVDKSLDEAQPNDYDAVLLPGGALNADAMRMEPKVQSFLKEMHQAQKPFAMICHAPWEVISADLVKGRTLTSYYTVQDDIRNAGGSWVDKEVVVDENWVSSRRPDDIPAFIEEMFKVFAPSGTTVSTAR
jgi:protease I